MNHPGTSNVLAHGILGFGDLLSVPLPVQYFNGIADHFRERGDLNEVIASQVDPIGSVAKRGGELGKAILELPATDEVHVIAHSMGGLDARYALANDRNVARRVRTLVTIGTPHQGSPVADAVVDGAGPLFEEIDDLPSPVPAFLDSIAGGLQNLTTAACAEFNNATPDVPGVRYIEVAGDASLGGNELFLFQLAAAVGRLHGANDGVVTKTSALREGREHLPDWPVDHAGEIGWSRRTILRLDPDWGAHLARYDAILARVLLH